MDLTQGSALSLPLAVMLLTEYGFKQWLETNAHLFGIRPWATYVLFRVAHFSVNLLVATLLLGFDIRLLGFITVIELLGLCELVLAIVERGVYRRFNIGLRWTHLLPMAGIVTWTVWQAQHWELAPKATAMLITLQQAIPGIKLHPGQLSQYVLALVFLAYPVNYIIRCLVAKRSDLFVTDLLIASATMKQQKVTYHEQIAATHEDAFSSAVPLRAGRTIGLLERWIIASLTVMGQMGLIGLVLTAKSIARFKRFEQDPEFAEYYLLGTLFSIFIALLVGVILKHA